MPCYHPMKGWRAKRANASGKRPVVFNKKDGYVDLEVQVPCGQCIGCRLERSRQWAIRCVHEAQMHEDNCFITLTYAPENLPPGETLVLRDFQLFMKRLRKEFGTGIRFFHCGEYGEKRGRPHYHAALFNFDFKDRVLFKEQDGVRLYVSESLQKLWPHGFCTVGDVTFESAAYIARYIMKKVSGEGSERHYEGFDFETGLIIDKKREYVTMSRRPGIGKEWYEHFRGDVYPSDAVVLRGNEMKPPKYYDGLFEIDDPDSFAKVKAARRASGKARADDNTAERLAVKEHCKLAQIKLLKRGYENEGI